MGGDNSISSGPKVSESTFLPLLFVNLGDPETWGTREGKCPMDILCKGSPQKYRLEGGGFGSGAGVRRIFLAEV